ncbi:MAG: right-handed parallel beta-helix repeat-containing protein, partial [Thermoplasmata archaeon]|nr:right-handed parallel beta-helix repeat-containing protein [Thermoplasmata archaeon]
IYVSAKWTDITNCRIQHNRHGAVAFAGQSSYNNIINCTINNNIFTYGCIHIYGGDYNNISYCTIENNTGTSASSGSITIGGCFNKVSHCKICNNTATYGGGFSISGHKNIIENCSVETNQYYGFYCTGADENTIVNCSVEGSDYGIYLKFSRNNSLRNCIVRSNRIGVYQTDNFDKPSMGNHVHNSKIYDGEEFGMKVTDKSILNATYNWWGDDSGPYHPTKNPWGKGDTVTDYVEFDPWLGKETKPEENRTIWYVDDDAPDEGNGSREHPFNKIQDAIDAAEEGGTIYVWKGVYYENVVVNKTVNLVGNGSADTKIYGGGNGDVVVITADKVIISGFRVTNSGTIPGDAGIKVTSNNNTISSNNCSYNRNGIYP